jgi:AAA+ ATPase superfamily predicted ATPase
MKFYDRQAELSLLTQNKTLSIKRASFTLMTGRRRIGKTALITESVKKQKSRKSLYLFVSRKNEALLCEEYQSAMSEVLGIQVFGTVSRFKDIFEQLLVYSADNPFTLVIDEFQDFERVNKSIFSEIQDLWDRYKDKAKIDLIVCGSVYSMMTRLFEDSREPLFGRLTSKIVLQPFPIKVIKKILKDHNPGYSPEDLLCLYMITGGVPKYISLLMDAGATAKDTMLDFFAAAGSPFLSDGKDILVSEFGRDYSTYFSILQLISAGKTSQTGIDSIIGKNTGSYLLNLEKEFSIIERNKPIFSKPESRNTKWRIRDNYLRFWFRFVYANQSLVETGRYDLLRELISADYTQYSGLILEDYFRMKFLEEGRYTKVGSSWDRKGTSEIDMVALNDLDKKALIAEVKRNSQNISMAVLAGKAESIKKDLSGYSIEYTGLSLNDL